jgi:hypothetical protein
VKWGGAVVSVVLLVVWVGSRWYDGVWWWGRGEVSVYAGLIWVQYDTRQPPPYGLGSGWKVRAYVPDFRWWFGSYTLGSGQTVYVPLWPVCMLAISASVIAWRLDTLARRRARAGFCPKCDYNRAGLAPNAVCPECGTPALAPPPAS